MGLLKNKGAKVHRGSMHDVAVALGIELPDGGSDEEWVEEMRRAFADRLAAIDKKDWIVCDACGEVTDDDDRIDVCPFCGDVGGDEYREVDLEDESDAEPEELPLAAADAPEEDGSSTTEPEPEPEDGEGDELAAGGASEIEIAFKREHETVLAAERGIVNNHYDIGLALKKIFDAELWKAAGHKTFRQYLKSVGMTHSYAYDLMDIVSQFDRDQFLDFGRRKLKLIGSTTEKGSPEREDMLGKAGSTSARRMEEETGGRSGGKSRKKAPVKEGKPPVTAPPAERSSDDTITLLAKVGGKPQTLRFLDRDTREEVKQWSPDTYLEIRISEDVSQLIGLKVDAKGNIIGASVVYRRRSEESAKSKAPTKKKAAKSKVPTKKKAAKSKATSKAKPAKKSTKSRANGAAARV